MLHYHFNNNLPLTELHEDHVGLLTCYVRAREVNITRATAFGTEQLSATQLHGLRRLALVSAATQRHHDLTDKEELAAFHTTMTQVTTQVSSATVPSDHSLLHPHLRAAS